MPDETTEQPKSHLFTVRIWLDTQGQPQIAWRGKVQHPASGAWRYFQDWNALTLFLQARVAELAAEKQQPSSAHSAESLSG